MIELLIVLVIISLLTGIIAPNLTRWLSSLELDEQKNMVVSEFASLPARAFFSEQEIVLDSKDKLSNEVSKNLTIVKPIHILSNGYCKGGEARLSINQSNYKIVVSAPFCTVTLFQLI